ncbi:MAG: inositol monophosphatase [Deltaproteobacteria bacterium]|nr:inositol monophosphatase [Deltaproteobacteria bacterium]
MTNVPRCLAADQALAMALDVAREAADLVKKGWGRVGEVRSKRVPTDLVTEWDLASERLIVERLAERAPFVRILGEEVGARIPEGASRERWLVDPIDGTVNFAHGLPLFSISIGYEAFGESEAGVVIAPALGWEFAAAKGKGAFMNGEPIHVSCADSLEKSLVATGFPYDRATSPQNNFREFLHMQRVCGGVRRLGSASLDLCLVARGWLDGYWEFKLKPWDLAAGTVIVREAGGRVTSLEGGPFSAEEGEAIASNGLIHEAMVRELAEVP